MTQASTAGKISEATRASPALSNNSTVAGSKRKRGADSKVYVVRVGKKPGIYETWDECLEQVKGHKGAIFKAFTNQSDAHAFLSGRSQTSSHQPAEQRFYAVQNGRIPGVYHDWPSALSQISGVKNPKYRRFNTGAEAEAYVAAGRKLFGHRSKRSPGLTPEEEKRQQIIRNSAPGLQTSGKYMPKDKEGTPWDLGRGPAPAGAEDGFDPNIKLNYEGRIVAKNEDERAKTKQVPKESDPSGMLRIYTDGSCLRNGQTAARAGVGVFFGPADPKNVSEALKGMKQTNQRAELTAILRALDIAPLCRDVTIYTDSKYSIDCVTNWYKNWEKNGWVNSKGKSVENKDLVMDVRAKIEEREELHQKTLFVWVKGHATDAGNIAADRLAVQGASSGSGTANMTGQRPNNPAETGILGMDEDTEDDVEQAFAAMVKAHQGKT